MQVCSFTTLLSVHLFSPSHIVIPSTQSGSPRPSINLGIISSSLQGLQQRLYFYLYFYSQSPCCDPCAMCMPGGKALEFDN